MRFPGALITAFVVALTLGLVAPVPDASAASVTGNRTVRVDTSGVTLNVGNLYDQYKTSFDATHALQGAPYTVTWDSFTSGAPLIAAMVNGSVDLGIMAETPSIFAQAAGDPVRVVAATDLMDPRLSLYTIMVPHGSPIKTVADLKGKTIATTVGAANQYVLLQALRKAGLPYSAVHVDNLGPAQSVAALEGGSVDAAVTNYPLTAIVEQSGKGTVLTTGAGVTRSLEYVVAPQSALQNKQKAAAIGDFIGRMQASVAMLAKNPALAAQTYVKTYGVTLPEAQASVAHAHAAFTPLNPSIFGYQQAEANAFFKLGLIPDKLNTMKEFDTRYNRAVTARLARSKAT